MRQIGIIRAKGRKNAKLKESVAVSRKRLDFITRDQRLRGEHVEKQPIVLMFDEVAFHEQPHDTTSLFNKMVGAFILRVLLGGASPSRAAASVAAVAVTASPSGFYVFSHHVARLFMIIMMTMITWVTGSQNWTANSQSSAALLSIDE